MNKSKVLKIISLLMVLSLVLAGCAGTNDNENTDTEETDNTTNTDTTDSEGSDNTTVTIEDAHGTVEVPVNPQVVVSLDNRTFETLADWGIELAAVPKDAMPADNPYVLDEDVLNVGNHREPDLEVIAAVNPDLVIVGQRFANFYDDIKELVPDAAVIDLNFDVSEEADSPGDNLINGLIDANRSLGKIFDKEAEAEELIASFEKSIEDAKAAYNGEETIMAVIVSGGDIGYSAPGSGRVWGPMYEVFDWTPALEVDDATSDHQGDDVSVEAIAESNPDWIFVLDRDAATSSAEGSQPAEDIIENSPALQNVTAVKEGNLIYAPDDTYTNESVQTYIELFNNLAERLSE